MSAPPLARAPIRVLRPRDAERIAAGEVVERPASVVKELVENALDAGARSVRVEIRGGGLRLVRVVDDGCGIPADEIALAFQRHATSKIRGVDDLDRLATLGFRGEALPSIAAVAEVVVLTAADDGGLGYEALLQGGAVAALTPRPRARGTTISVRYLFQTVPARLKFVASARHEVAAIGALVRRFALAYPAVRFGLLLEGRVAWQSSGDGLAATLAEVYGTSVAEALRPLPALEVADSRWHGYLGERHVTRPNRGGVDAHRERSLGRGARAADGGRGGVSAAAAARPPSDRGAVRRVGLGCGGRERASCEDGDQVRAGRGAGAGVGRLGTRDAWPRAGSLACRRGPGPGPAGHHLSHSRRGAGRSHRAAGRGQR